MSLVSQDCRSDPLEARVDLVKARVDLVDAAFERGMVLLDLCARRLDVALEPARGDDDGADQGRPKVSSVFE